MAIFSDHTVGNIIKGIVRLPTSLCEDRLKGQALDETMMCTSAGPDQSMCLVSVLTYFELDPG